MEFLCAIGSMIGSRHRCKRNGLGDASGLTGKASVGREWDVATRGLTVWLTRVAGAMAQFIPAVCRPRLLAALDCCQVFRFDPLAECLPTYCLALEPQRALHPRLAGAAERDCPLLHAFSLYARRVLVHSTAQSERYW